MFTFFSLRLYFLIPCYIFDANILFKQYFYTFNIKVTFLAVGTFNLDSFSERLYF